MPKPVMGTPDERRAVRSYVMAQLGSRGWQTTGAGPMGPPVTISRYEQPPEVEWNSIVPQWLSETMCAYSTDAGASAQSTWGRIEFARRLSERAQSLYSAAGISFAENSGMAIDVKPGGTVRVTINKNVTRHTARKTLERLFMSDKEFAHPIELRSRNFKARPKRRGGRIWTKYPNKIHPALDKGAAATIKATPQHLRDLKSVEDFVTVQSG